MQEEDKEGGFLARCLLAENLMPKLEETGFGTQILRSFLVFFVFCVPVGDK